MHIGKALRHRLFQWEARPQRAKLRLSDSYLPTISYFGRKLLQPGFIALTPSKWGRDWAWWPHPVSTKLSLTPLLPHTTSFLTVCRIQALQESRSPQFLQLASPTALDSLSKLRWPSSDFTCGLSTSLRPINYVFQIYGFFPLLGAVRWLKQVKQWRGSNLSPSGPSYLFPLRPDVRIM